MRACVARTAAVLLAAAQKWLFELTIGAALIIVCQSTPTSAADCMPNTIRSVAGPGRLVISQAAVTKIFDECPTIDLGRKLSINQPIYIWLRLEGDREFASAALSHDQFTILLRRSGALRGHLIEFAIADRKLGIAEIRAEAELPDNNGFFDWRLYARTRGFVVPGIYRMIVLYGNRHVCQAAGSCEIVFEVEGGKRR